MLCTFDMMSHGLAVGCNHACCAHFVHVDPTTISMICGLSRPSPQVQLVDSLFYITFDA